MDKKVNVLRKWWFNFVGVPVITILFTFFVPWEETEKVLLSYSVLMISAFVIQAFFIFKYKVKYGIIHYAYILISMNLSLFLSFIISKIIHAEFDSRDLNKYIVGLIVTAYSSVILFVIKWIVWGLLHLKYLKSVNRELLVGEYQAEISDSHQKIKELEIENAKLNGFGHFFLIKIIKDNRVDNFYTSTQTEEEIESNIPDYNELVAKIKIAKEILKNDKSNKNK